MSDRRTPTTPGFMDLVKIYNKLNPSTKEKFSIDKFPVDEKMIPPSFQVVLKDSDYDIKATEIDNLVKDFGKSPNNLDTDQINLRKKYLDILLDIMKKGTGFVKTVISFPPEETWQGFNGLNTSLDLIKNSISSGKVKTELEKLSTILKEEETKKMSQIDIKKIEDQINIVKSSEGGGGAEILNNFEQEILRLKREKEVTLRGLDNFDAGFNTVKRIAELLKSELKPPSPCVIPPCNEKKYMISTAILSIILGIAIISFIIFMMFFRNKR
jgi:hypothetical protein